MADQIPGRRVPFYTRTEPSEIPQILASEVGAQKMGAVLAASLLVAVTPGQILGRVDSTKEYIPVKTGTVKTAIADTTAATTIVMDDSTMFAAGDVLTIALDAGNVTKTIDSIVHSTGTITLTAAIGAGALSIGARVNTTAATGGTAVAIAGQYANGGTDAVAYQQMLEVYTAGNFKKAKLIGYNAHCLSDFGGREKAAIQNPERNGGTVEDVVAIF